MVGKGNKKVKKKEEKKKGRRMRLEVEMSRYLKVEEESNLIDIHINFILKKYIGEYTRR